MTFVQARNAVVAGLEAHLGCQVNLSDQIAGQPEYPYCYYSVLTPRAADHTLGLRDVREAPEGCILSRTERVAATMSFTLCSMNRETEDGYIYGEDEALELAEKANGFFLLNGHGISTDEGDVVVSNVGSVVPRNGFLVEDTVRRYGFDIKISYMRTDEMPASTISTVHPVGDVH